MRKVDDGEKRKEKRKKKEKEKKIMAFIVATNGIASRPPNAGRLERRTLVPIFYGEYLWKVWIITKGPYTE